MLKRHCDFCEKIIIDPIGLHLRIQPTAPNIDIHLDICNDCKSKSIRDALHKAIEMADTERKK